MTVIWLTTSFSFYLISFLLTHFGQVYTTTIFSSISDLGAYTVAGNVFKCLGVKKTYLLGYSISSIGGIILLFFGLKHQNAWYFPVLVVFAKFGVALSFGVNYISNSYLFPTLFAATAIGLCNTIARVFSAMSPILAQMDEPLPMVLFSCASLFTFAFIFFLQVPKSSPDELLNKPTANDSLMRSSIRTETNVSDTEDMHDRSY
jgi:MFS family permease